MSKRIVILGTNHRAQAHYDDEPNEIGKVLECLLKRHSDTRAILEERDSKGCWPREGSVVAKARGLSWENIGTPDGPEFDTGHKLNELGIHIYGPLRNQIRREEYFLDRIRSIMDTRDQGLFICGLAHIQSMGEKLFNSGFVVEAYEWQPNEQNCNPRRVTLHSEFSGPG